MKTQLIKELYEKIVGKDYELNILEDTLSVRLKKYLVSYAKTNDDFSINEVDNLLDLFQNNFKHIKKLCSESELMEFLSGNSSASLKNLEIEDEDFPLFIANNFEDIIFENFKKILIKGKYYPLKELFFEKGIYSENINERVVAHFINIIEVVEQELAHKKIDTAKQQLIIRNNNFFYFAGLINDIRLEIKLKKLYNPLIDLFKGESNRHFFAKCLIAYSYYTFTSDSFNELIEDNKKVAERQIKFSSDQSYQSETGKRFKESSDSNFAAVFFIMAIMLPIAIFIVSSLDSKPKKPAYVFDSILDPFSKNDRFFNYISCHYCNESFDTTILEKYTLQTGEMPFDYLPTNKEYTDFFRKKTVLIYNQSDYEIVVISYLQSDDAANLSYLTSTYINKAESFELPVGSSNLVHIFYVGNDLAEYKVRGELSEYNIKENQPRFLNILPNRDVLKYKFLFKNHVVFYNNEDYVYVKSEDLKYYVKGSSYPFASSHVKIKAF